MCSLLFIATICLVCGDNCNEGKVHLECLSKYPWCLRCERNNRKTPSVLCEECYREHEGIKIYIMPTLN